MATIFEAAIAAAQASPCIEWQGERNPDGYGKVRTAPGKRGYAHRIAYEKAYGPIPPGKVVHHRCDNPPCVNPAHLVVGTQKDNLTDAAVRRRFARQARTTCKNGHPFDAEKRTPHGLGRRRVCRTCQNDANRRYRASAAIALEGR